MPLVITNGESSIYAYLTKQFFSKICLNTSVNSSASLCCVSDGVFFGDYRIFIEGWTAFILYFIFSCMCGRSAKRPIAPLDSVALVKRSA